VSANCSARLWDLFLCGILLIANIAASLTIMVHVECIFIKGKSSTVISFTSCVLKSRIQSHIESQKMYGSRPEALKVSREFHKKNETLIRYP